ncbi:CocE/NonD family hydrolase [Martelella endophytica]|uniref:Esterase n=1 Tax=Martelella endophytica TaxID=1486262 RepID=A0A0D5LRE5_MAREN|nr:CocE/NonD family hydrolase [Martelella endophytica]AJY45893.1 esterase [Martelella endophytica]
MKQFTIRDGVPVVMRDGVTLFGDLWLPEGEGPFPVLLQRTPYRREDIHGAQYISALEFQSALRRGMAVMVQDTRGRFASEGEFVPFAFEGRDGVDTIAWLRRQDFCNGQVGMFGASYVGATQVLAAAENPPGLEAIAPQLTTARHGESWTWRGGATELGFLMLWIIEALAPPDLERRLASLPAEQAGRLTALMHALQRDPQAGFARLPLLDADLAALAPYATQWFDERRAQAASGDREHLDAIAKCRPAMLVTAGWNDLFLEGSLELFRTARGRHDDPAAVRDRLLIGPWSHGNPKDWQGAFWHGPEASTAGLSDVQLDFFEAVFSGGVPSGPMVRYFRTGSNSWHDASDWPVPATGERCLYLDGDSLSEAVPALDFERRWISDPSNPVPTSGGATFLPGLLLGRNSGPMPQDAVEARSDVVTFTSAPLDTDLDVTGSVEARLFVTSDAATADWTARLCEVTPDGRSSGIVDGILRWKKPHGEDGPFEVTVTLGHISHLFAKSSRLRLQVASSNFPRFDRNPQSGTAPERATAADFRSARHTVLGGPVMPSCLRLPVTTGFGLG